MKELSGSPCVSVCVCIYISWHYFHFVGVQNQLFGSKRICWFMFNIIRKEKSEVVKAMHSHILFNTANLAKKNNFVVKGLKFFNVVCIIEWLHRKMLSPSLKNMFVAEKYCFICWQSCTALSFYSSSSEYSAQGQVLHRKLRNQGYSSAQRQLFHHKLRNSGCSFTKDG